MLACGSQSPARRPENFSEVTPALQNHSLPAPRSSAPVPRSPLPTPIPIPNLDLPLIPHTIDRHGWQ